MTIEIDMDKQRKSAGKRLRQLLSICHKKLDLDLNAITLQQVGSVANRENLTEILAQIETKDLQVILGAFKCELSADLGNAVDRREFMS